MTEPQGVRARARAALLADVGRVARSHLAESGAAALSVRAIARELGLASSALYRYYPSRDALLTELIMDSYNSLGESAEVAEAAIDRSDLAGRYSAVAHAVRDWALARPHEYALIYGSPVPGYAAPDDTIDPAIRVAMLMVRLSAEVAPTNDMVMDPGALHPLLAGQLAAICELAGVNADPTVLAIGTGLWAQIYGLVSFELFGTFKNSFDDASALFDFQVQAGIAAMGIA